MPRKVIKGKNDLETVNPELAAQWHPTKNGELMPDDVAPMSDKKVWWLGKCGHEWQAEISSRTQGHGCPYCSNQKILSGYNDLATVNPKLASEWNYEKNGDLLPSMVAPKSSHKVWWLGECGHEWQAAISSRSTGHGCPYCSNQKILSGYNDLATINPKLASEWNYEKNGDLLPSMVAPNSNHKVWWKCKKGHEWQNSPNLRKNNGCPYCSNQMLLSGYNDIETTNPEALSEWDYVKNAGIDPRNLQAGSEKKVWWRCTRGHSYQMQVDLKVKYGYDCPICSRGRHVSFPEKAVAYYFKSIDSSIVEGYRDNQQQITELDVFLPTKRIGIEYDGKRWHNKNNAQKDVIKNENCKKAGITLYRIRENGCYPLENSSSVDCYYNPNNVASLEGIIKYLIHLIYNVECNVDIQRDRIRIYKQIEIWFEHNSAELLESQVLAEWDYEKNLGLEPGNFSANTHKKVWWTCSKCGGSWQASIANRNNNRGCPYCTGHKLLVGYNDLATVAPECLKEWDYEKNSILPSNISAHSSEKVWWKCKNGHSFCARVSNRVDLGRGCPICANRTIVVGINDLATTNPELLEDWDYTKNEISPTDISAGSSKMIWWKCSRCGYEWKTSLASRKNKETGCPQCADEKKGNALRRKVQQVSLKGDVIREYLSIKEASQSVNRSPSAIVNACKGKVSTCAGYVWRYASDEVVYDK